MICLCHCEYLIFYFYLMNRFIKSATTLAVTAIALTACIPGSDTSFSGDDIVNDNLSMMEQDGYVFYYPSDYEEYDNELQDLSFRSSSTNDIGGSNNLGLVVTPNEEVGAKPTDEECADIANQLASLLDGNVEESAVIDDGGMYGCSNVITASFETEVGTTSLVSVNKTVYEAGQTEADVFSVNATYEPDADATEIQNLKDSIAKFKLSLGE